MQFFLSLSLYFTLLGKYTCIFPFDFSNFSWIIQAEKNNNNIIWKKKNYIFVKIFSTCFLFLCRKQKRKKKLLNSFCALDKCFIIISIQFFFSLLMIFPSTSDERTISYPPLSRKNVYFFLPSEIWVISWLNSNCRYHIIVIHNRNILFHFSLPLVPFVRYTCYLCREWREEIEGNKSFLSYSFDISLFIRHFHHA